MGKHLLSVNFIKVPVERTFSHPDKIRTVLNIGHSSETVKKTRQRTAKSEQLKAGERRLVCECLFMHLIIWFPGCAV
jgi:hypothetical protein